MLKYIQGLQAVRSDAVPVVSSGEHTQSNNNGAVLGAVAGACALVAVVAVVALAVVLVRRRQAYDANLLASDYSIHITTV